MKWIVFSLLIAVVASDIDIKEKFKNFVKEHGKVYKNPQQTERALQFFTKNQKYVDDHNAKFAAGLVNFSMAVYHFMDDDIQAYANATCRTRVPASIRALPQSTQPPVNSFPMANPSENFTTSCLPVVNQGACGSCWAFAATAQIECARNKKNPAVYTDPLSQQYLLDCDHNDNGCNGGWPKTVLDFIVANGEVANSAYPYTGVQGTCKSVAKVSLPPTPTAYQYNLLGDENGLKTIVSTVGPVVVSIYASTSFHAYKNGIFSDSTCPTDCGLTNHSVLVVGYGADSNGNNYWIIRNQYGASWGEQGYMRIARGNNNCLTACYASYAVMIN